MIGKSEVRYEEEGEEQKIAADTSASMVLGYTPSRMRSLKGASVGEECVGMLHNDF